MSDYEQIVRELAERDPDVAYYDGCCNFCGADLIVKPEPHDPDCLWLRAKQAVESAESFVVLKPLPAGTPLGYGADDPTSSFWVKITGLDYVRGVSGGDICLDGTMHGTAYTEVDQ